MSSTIKLDSPASRRPCSAANASIQQACTRGRRGCHSPEPWSAGARSDRGEWWGPRGGAARAAGARIGRVGWIERSAGQPRLGRSLRYAKVRCALTLLVARRRLARALPPLAPSRCRLAPAPTPPGPTPSSSSASLFLGRSARPTSHAPSHALSEERSPERAPQLAPPPPSRRATPSRRSFAPGHPFNVMAASVELPCFRAAYGLTLHAKAAPVPRVETGRRVLAAWRYMHMSVE